MQNNDRDIKRLILLLLEIMQYEGHKDFYNKAAKLQKEIDNAKQNGDMKSYLKAAAELDDCKLMFEKYDERRLDKFEGFIDNKYRNSQDLQRLIRLLESGEAETLDEAILILEKDRTV